MSNGRYEVVGRLPPGQGGKTSLAVMGGGQAFKRVAVLRPVGEAALIPVANLHPQLPAPLGVDEVEGSSYAVYDFFPGATLREIADVYRQQDQLPPLGLAVRIVMDAARIIHLAHEHVDALGGHSGFVHGGIADSSLLLGFDGEVRVIDFGLRKMNRFASPEAVAGGPFTAKSDVFSLAAALHAALTGFDKSYAATLARAPSAREFPPPSAVHPDASRELDALLMRSLLPDPERRLASAAELADDLERIVGSQLPQPQACATRLRQLFEERLDGFRNMVPKLSAEAAQPAAGAAAKQRSSKPSLPALQPTPPPRKSGPRSPIPMGTQPEANPIGRRPTPPEVKAAFGDPDGLEDERTILAEPGLVLAKSEPMKTKVESTRAERPPVRSSGPKKPPAPLPDVPWEEGPLRAEPTTGQTDLRASAAPAAVSYEDASEDAVPIEDVPTGLTRRATGAHAALGGSTRAEKARARGQELVDTGEIEGEEADDLRDQPTVVKVTGAHAKLVVEPPAPEDVAAAFGDPDELAEEPGTAIITSNDGPKAKAKAEGAPEPPMLTPVVDIGDAPTTGVLEQAKKKPEKVESAEPKKKSSAARKLIAFMLLLMAGGFGFAMLKYPAQTKAKLAPLKAKLAPLKAKLDAQLVKLGIKKEAPGPPPEEPGQPVADAADGGEAAPLLPPVEVADAGAPPPPLLAPLDEDVDGGEYEYEDDDGGVVSGDGGHHSDGGAASKVKKKKKKKRREWWKTQ